MTVPGERDEAKLAIIEALKHFPEQLAAETAGLSDAVLRYRPAEAEWSITEVVGHCWFGEEIWYRRLFQVWSLTDPVLMRWQGEEAALQQAYAAQDLRPFLDELATRRGRTVDLLSNAIDWTRIGQWTGEGRRSFKQLAAYLVGHDANHLAQVRALKEAQTVARLP
jgi:uncharacterized damage-inducible protein DinB